MVSMASRADAAAAHGAILIAQGIWATWNVVSRHLVTSGADPVIFATYREALCALVLIVLAVARRYISSDASAEYLLPLSRRDVLLLATCGTALGGMQLLFLFGVARVEASIAGLSNLLIPVLTLIATAALGWEPLPLVHAPAAQLRTSYIKVAGVACACAGCAVLVLMPGAGSGETESSRRQLATTADAAVGGGFLLLSACGGVVFTLSQKPLLRRFGEIDTLAACYTVATAVAVAVCAVRAALFPPASPVRLTLRADEAIALLYTVGLVGVGAYSLFTYANARLPATVVTLYGITQPLLTGLLAVAILHEPIAQGTLAGGPLLVLGPVLTTGATRAAGADGGSGTLAEALLRSKGCSTSPSMSSIAS